MPRICRATLRDNMFGVHGLYPGSLFPNKGAYWVRIGCVLGARVLTTTGLRQVMNIQKRERSSISAMRTEFFSVSSRTRNLPFTSCSALSRRHWISLLPAMDRILSECGLREKDKKAKAQIKPPKSCAKQGGGGYYLICSKGI